MELFGGVTRLIPFTSADQDRMGNGKIMEMKSLQRNSQGLFALAAYATDVATE